MSTQVPTEEMVSSPDVASEDLRKHGVHVTRAFTINKPAAELFRFWRDFENLPTFMTHVESVTLLDDRHSHWKVKGPGSRLFEWDAEIINEEADRLIAWRSLEGADVRSAGSVRFIETGDRGTEVHVVLDYIPPVGKLGSFLAKVSGEDPAHQIQEDLRRFKQLMEAGEITTNEGPRGDCKGDSSLGDQV